MRIAILPNLKKDGAEDVSRKIIGLLKEKAYKAAVHKSIAEIFPEAEAEPDHDQLAKNCDIIITVGGDGTIIHAAKHAVKYNIPILGVNLGRVGYLAGIEPEDLQLIPEVIDGNNVEEYRMLLSVKTKGKEYFALNEGVISGELSRILDYEISVNNTKGYLYRADGLIVATPTGSTAYSLSAGGPVVDPDMKCITFTPICPYSLFNRSVVCGGKSEVTVKILPGESGKVLLTLDGETVLPLNENDELKFSVSEKSVKLLRYGDSSFFDTLNKKLISLK
ncbi:MAG: NAD(+)/NADH kinase [Clostridia bacterium]|nr:NAD(+)/NADH kinase [Clostridia bacterium]